MPNFARRVLLAAFSLVAGTFVACGGTDDGRVELVSDAAVADATQSTDTGSVVDSGSDTNVDPPDAGGIDAGRDAADSGVDAAIACTVATVGSDCPPQPCQALTGCVNGSCQYVATAVCVARSFSGTFVTGDFQATVGTTVVTGQIGPFLQEQGPTCVSGTCVTGDLLP